MQLVEAEEPSLVRDGGRREPQRIGIYDLAPLELCRDMNALMHLGHELMKMHPTLAQHRRAFKKHVHQHCLAAAHLAEDVPPLGRRGASTCREQPAQG